MVAVWLSQSQPWPLLHGTRSVAVAFIDSPFPIPHSRLFQAPATDPPGHRPCRVPVRDVASMNAPPRVAEVNR
ncbi:MAG: hypothetical protein ACR2J7_09640, partial [Luteimonas sp.]